MDTAEQLEIAIPEAAHRLAVTYLPRERIHPDPAQPRKDADAELRASIAREGLLQPVTVRPHPEILGEFMLVDGERRWRGAEGILEDGIPAIVRDDKDDAFQRLAAQLIANSGKPLTPMEEARAYATLLEARPGTSLADLATLVGRPRSTVGDRLSLLQLGPWVPLIDVGKVPISVVTRFLTPYRTLSDATHAAAIETIRKQLGADLDQAGDASKFARAIEAAYYPLLYPLTTIRNGFENPIFPTKAHDTECDCGRISIAKYGDKPRDYCGNPEWWKPLEKAAKAAERKKTKATAPKTAARRPAGPRLHLPDGVKVKDVGWEGTPKGHVELTDRAGKWNISTPHGTGVMGPHFFDPSSIAIDDRKLGAIRNGAAAVVTTRDEEAVRAARKAWAQLRESTIKECRERFENVVAKKTRAHAVQGKGAPLILAAVLHGGDRRGNVDISFEDAAAIAGVEIPASVTRGDRWEIGPRLAKWAAGLTEKQASAMLTIIAIVQAGNGVKWPLTEAEEKLDRMAAAIQKKPIPWLAKEKPSKGGKVAGGGDAERANDAGEEVEDAGDEDDDA